MKSHSNLMKKYLEMACLIVDIDRRYVYNKRSEERTWEKYLDHWRQLHFGKSDESIPSEIVMDDRESDIIPEEAKELEELEEEQPKKPIMERIKDGEMYLLEEVNEWYWNNPTYNSDEYPDLGRLLETYKDQFINLDVEGNGYLETKDLENIMKRHTRVSHSEVKKMIGELDREDRGCISYNDYLYNMLKGEKSVLKNTLKFAIATKTRKTAPKSARSRDVVQSPSPSLGHSPKHVLRIK